MQSAATTVSEYLETVPPDRLPAMARLRALCQDILTDYEESMTYGMPCFMKEGKFTIAFNSQKNYISLYIGKSIVDAYRDELKGASCGGGCIRWTKPEKIDFELVEKMLNAAKN